jgi:single-stranded-DNA-specific exonuclease
MIAQKGVLARARWRLAPAAPAALAAALPDLPPVVLAALLAAGAAEPELAQRFLKREPGDDDPFRMAGMGQAVARLRQALRAGEAIAVYGDYDADGVTATALLSQTLRALGGRVLPYLPHREREGYGVHAEALEALADAGATVVVTVDCGIRAADEIEAARRRGMDVIVTDHHALPEFLPSALAVINPRRPDCAYGDSGLAGVGLAYKLSQALLRADAADEGLAELREGDLLDLVAIGTVADVVPLRGENRALVAGGLALLREARRPGIAAMLSLMDQDPRTLTARHIGFGIGPRLNAAGRMDDAASALALLEAPDSETALPLARVLEAENQRRRSAMRIALDAASLRVEAEGSLPSFLVDADEGLPLGVVGLVAGRLSERYYRPAAVIRIEGELARGSARSIAEFDLIAAMDRIAPIFLRHGGHARAAGFTLRSEDLPRLRELLEAQADAALEGKDLRPTLDIAALVSPQDIDWGLQAAIEALEPFGEGNPQPRLCWLDAPVGLARTVGADGGHLKLVLEGGAGRGSIDAIAFGRGADRDLLGDRVDLVFTLDVNEWRGKRRLQLMVEDLAAPGTGLARD